MPASRSFRSRWTLGVLPVLLGWRHSLFWTIVPAMFLTSCTAAAILMISATYQEDARLRQALAPSALQAAMQAALRRASALTLPSGAVADACGDTLHVAAERILAQAMGDRTGDSNANGFWRAAQEGRVAVVLHAADGGTCRFPQAGTPPSAALARQMRTLAGQPSGGVVADTGDGWISGAAVALHPGSTARLAAGVEILSPWAKLTAPRSLTRAIAVFILSINTLSALVLVLLLIRRIRRADQAAAAWTLGQLATRIDDRGRDEFSRLTRKFDLMADAMTNLIAVKQALAAAQERNRVARDLHDSVKQRAFALNLRLSIVRETMAPQDQGSQHVDAALALTGQLQQDLANILRQLAAPTVAETGLRHALAESAQAMFAGGRAAYSISLSDEDDRLLTSMPDVAQQLALITTEAMSNALQHAGCSHCAISGERSGASYTWRIVDNGAGLPSAPGRKTGMGMSNMALRAASLNHGSFAIEPAERGGTAVVVTFQLHSTTD